MLLTYPQMAGCCNPNSPSLKAALGRRRCREELRAGSLRQPGRKRHSEGTEEKKTLSVAEKRFRNRCSLEKYQLLSWCKSVWAPSSPPLPDSPTETVLLGQKITHKWSGDACGDVRKQGGFSQRKATALARPVPSRGAAGMGNVAGALCRAEHEAGAPWGGRGGR